MGRPFIGSKTVNRFWMAPLAGLLMSALAVGPAQAEIKIGVVNAARLLQESPQAKAVQESLRSEFAPKQRELAAQQAALKAKQEKYEKDAPTMSGRPARQSRERAARWQPRIFRQKVTDFQEDANTRQNEETLATAERDHGAEVQSYALIAEVRSGADRRRGVRQQLSSTSPPRCWPDCRRAPPSQRLRRPPSRPRRRPRHEVALRAGSRSRSRCWNWRWASWRCALAASCAAIPRCGSSRVATLAAAGPTRTRLPGQSAVPGAAGQPRGAAAVVLDAASACAVPGRALVHGNPYATYARIAALAASRIPPTLAGVHPTAVIRSRPHSSRRAPASVPMWWSGRGLHRRAREHRRWLRAGGRRACRRRLSYCIRA